MTWHRRGQPQGRAAGPQHDPRIQLGVARAMVPVTLLLAVWIWCGRALFGATLGWMFLLVIPVGGIVPLVILLLPAHVVRSRGKGHEPRRMLHPNEVVLQVQTWLGMFATGLVLVDETDVSGSSVLTRLGVLSDKGGLSFGLTAAAVAFTGLAGVSLLTTCSRNADPRGLPPGYGPPPPGVPAVDPRGPAVQ